jgi:hypothetical protein
MKTCNKCNIKKSFDCYGRLKSTLDGYRYECKECRNSIQRNKYKNTMSEWRKNNKEIINTNRKIYYQKNNEKFKEISKKNRETLGNYNETKNKWYNEKMKNDPIFKSWENLSCNFRNRFNKNGIGLEKLVGYSKKQLIEKLGQPKIDDDLDHKIPVSWFKIFQPEIVYSLDNLQWLNKHKNRKKNNHYCHPISISYFIQIKPILKDEYIENIILISN